MMRYGNIKRQIAIEPPGGWVAESYRIQAGQNLVQTAATALSPTATLSGADMETNYAMPGPITLYDGTVISNPESTPPTADQCLAGQCGWGTQAYKYWCSYWGQPGNRTCADPSCGPFCAPMPQTMTAPMPSIPATLDVTGTPSPQPPQLTPQTLLDKMPSIIAPAISYVPPACSSPIAEFVQENKGVVMVGLLLGVVWAWGGFKKL